MTTLGGPFGKLLEGLLADENIQIHSIPINDWTRESFIVYEINSDQQYRFGTPGPDLGPEEWQNVLQYISDMPSPHYLVASGGLPRGVPKDFYARLARIANERGIKLMVDTHGEALASVVEEGIFLIKPNWAEFKALMHHADDHVLDAELLDSAENFIQNKKCDVLVVSLGAAGGLLVWDHGCERIHVPSVPIKSKVGAGDSMVAGIVLGLAREYTILDAIKLGLAAGTAAVMTPGTELCREEDTTRLFNKMKTPEVR